MDLICPDCRSPLQMASARMAVCAQHGGRYEVLFDRDAIPAPAAAPVVAEVASQTETACAVHPRQKAVGDCAACQKPICALCSFDLNRERYCSDCAADQASLQSQQMANGGLITLNLTPVPSGGWRRRDAPPANCADHPDNPSVAACKLCAKPVCATCDFALPGGVHLCPTCVEASESSTEVNPKRKKLSYIALALAVWSTVMLVLMFSGAFNSLFTDDEGGKAADVIITNITLWPLLIGTGLAMSAIDRRLKSTGIMKVAVWWNGVLAGIFLLFIIAANLGVFG
jgi:hypothetical protein